MMHLYKRLLEHIDGKTLAFFSKINIYGFGLLVFWTVANITLLPTRVDETAPRQLQGSALGLISFLGVGFAVFIQPIAGRLSDAWPGADKRRPFIIAGTLLVIPGLILFGAARGFTILLLGFILMQLATNISQAGFQAFIPDLVDEDQRGIASGVKNILSVLGTAFGLIGAQALFAINASSTWVVLYIGTVLVITGALTVIWVPRISGKRSGRWREAITTALSPHNVREEVSGTLREHAMFRFGVLAQFLFMLGTYPAQRFLLLFLRDRFGDNAISLAAIGGLLAIVLAIAAAGVAGVLSDIIGRSKVLIGTAIIGSFGMILIGFSPTLSFAAVAGGLIAAGYGAFLSVNWALLNDDLPEGQSAAALGVANIATAGAGAMAGLFGPIVDVMNAIFPQGTYEVLFGVAGIVAALSIWPLRRISTEGLDEQGG